MKLNKIFLPIVIAAFTLNSCDDDKMEWGRPDGQDEVTMSEIPLELKEKIANYDYIKAYAAKHMPNALIGIGLGADFYVDDEDYRKVANDNFQMITTGNAMKHASVVKNNGDLDFTTIDKFFGALPADMPVYGHTFLWHVQQRAAYLNAIIAPDVIVDSSDGIENVIGTSDFEAGNISGWGAWSSAGATAVLSAQGEGYNSDYALKLNDPAAGGANHSAQAYYTLPTMMWEVGETYVYSLWVYSVEGDANFQLQLQNRTSYDGGAYKSQSVPAGQWFYFEAEFEMTQAIIDLAVTHLTIDFGASEGDCFIDNVQFGKKVNNPDAGRTNMLTNGNFASGISGWSIWNGEPANTTYNSTEGNQSPGCLQIVNPSDNANGEWKVQNHTDLTIAEGTTFYVSYYIKVASGTGAARVSTSGKAHYQGSQTVTTTWTRKEWTVTATGDIDGLNFDLGLTAGTYLIDDVVVSTDPFNVVTRGAVSRAVQEIPKTPEEKRQILLDAMETWIKGMLDHCKERVSAWDVLNEPITDGGQLRGIDGNIPSDLGDQEFYWGEHIGKDYAVIAFQLARQYSKPTDKLFINDYGLETNATKLAALIDYVNYIDQENGSPIVDGIGTQMHVTATAITKEQVDQMFKTLANTGKLIRVTELDVQVGTATPSFDQLEKQAEVYQMIVESYKENVPEAQQSGITIWTLTDHKREHEYWLPGDAPNLFDTDYGRKYAYKTFCDGIAGYDVSTDFSGNDWENAYPKEEETEDEPV